MIKKQNADFGFRRILRTIFIQIEKTSNQNDNFWFRLKLETFSTSSTPS